jgi:hypothetical protein
MLKHRLTRRLSTLFMLVAVLMAVASAPTASAKMGPYCEREITHEGCVEICCTGTGCMVAPCN